MSDLFTTLRDTPGNDFALDIVHAQDVEPCTDFCAQKRLESQQGKQGLGIMTASIPVVEFEKAKHRGIDLTDKKVRERWLALNPQYRTYVKKGLSGKTVIK